jgi:hypothetical protein
MLMSSTHPANDRSDESRCFWFSRSAAALDAEAEYLLVGLVLGLAIHNGVILDLHFPPLLWSRLMNEPVGLAQLQQTHPDLYRGLRSLLTFEGDVESVFMSDFSVTCEAFGSMTVEELKPGGAAIPVTNDNRAEYAELYAVFLLNTRSAFTPHPMPFHRYAELYADFLLNASVAPQFNAFQQGFLLLCDGVAFSLLTPRELEQLVCGVPHLSFTALQANTTYDGGFDAHHPTVAHFWEVVHSLSAEDQRRLLFFATGCDRAATGGSCQPMHALTSLRSPYDPQVRPCPDWGSCQPALHLAARRARFDAAPHGAHVLQHAHNARIHLAGQAARPTDDRDTECAGLWVAVASSTTAVILTIQNALVRRALGCNLYVVGIQVQVQVQL